MSILQEKLLELNEEEESKKNDFLLADNLEVALLKVDKIITIIGIIISVCILTYVYIINYKTFDLSVIIYYFFVGIYPTCIILWILKLILNKPFQNAIYSSHKLSKIQLQEINDLKKRFVREKYTITKEMHKEQEEIFIKKLNDFVNKLSNKNIQINEAEILKDELLKENSFIKTNGYQIHTNIYYNNRFDKISDLFKGYESWQDFSSKNRITDKSTNDFKSFKETFNSNLSVKPSVIETKIKVKPNDSAEEKGISDLFKKVIEAKTITKSEFKENRTAIKTDYLKLNALRQNIGKLGEQYALELEKNRLLKNGLTNYSSKIRHVSIVNDVLGYDIESFLEDGKLKFIEVKTTTDNCTTPFYLSENELTAMKELNNYFIYRVYNFNQDTCKGEHYVIDCKKDMDIYFQLEATSYRVYPNL